MGTLEDPNEGNGSQIMRVIRDNMKGRVYMSPNQHEYENPMPLKMISYLLCDENFLFKDCASAKI